MSKTPKQKSLASNQILTLRSETMNQEVPRKAITETRSKVQKAPPHPTASQNEEEKDNLKRTRKRKLLVSTIPNFCKEHGAKKPRTTRPSSRLIKAFHVVQKS